MKILELIFPNNIKCINCGKEIERENIFCKNCENKIKIINSREKINNLNIYSPFKYCDIIKNLILNFKYNNKNYLAQPLAKLLVKNYNFKNIDFITFIPLNKNKLKIRGFNQAKLLAKEISKITKIPLLPTLEKIVDTPSQTTKNYLERQTNIKDSFIVKEESLLSQFSFYFASPTETRVKARSARRVTIRKLYANLSQAFPFRQKKILYF